MPKKTVFPVLFLLIGLTFIALSCGPNAKEANEQEGKLTLKKIGEYKTHLFDKGAAEIIQYDSKSKRLYFTDGNTKQVVVLDIQNPNTLKVVNRFSIKKYGYSLNSVAVHNGIIAVAVEAKSKQKKGKAVFFDENGKFLKAFTVGALPDMITFSHDGKKVLVANEGEPNDSYTKDPEGSVSIIDLSKGIKKAKVKTIHFRSLSKADLDESTRIGKPGQSPAQDFEPEYIAISQDNKRAFVTLQENNAVAIIDLENAKLIKVKGLGFKDHSKEENGFDASDKSKKIEIKPHPVKGMYMPDSIASYTINGKTYYVIANEGDSRDYKGFSEETRVAKLKLDPKYFPNAKELQKKTNLGRLKTTTTMGDKNGDGLYEEIYSYGARSISVLDSNGNMLSDSKNIISKKLAVLNPKHFNANEDNNKLKNRSDDKGSEPEGLDVGEINGRFYAFVGLERDSGIMVFDVTNPKNIQYVTYISTRNFNKKPNSGYAGDIAPEGLEFIHASKSPNGKPLLAVAYEVSGSVALFEINLRK